MILCYLSRPIFHCSECQPCNKGSTSLSLHLTMKLLWTTFDIMVYLFHRKVSNSYFGYEAMEAYVSTYAGNFKQKEREKKIKWEWRTKSKVKIEQTIFYKSDLYPLLFFSLSLSLSVSFICFFSLYICFFSYQVKLILSVQTDQFMKESSWWFVYLCNVIDRMSIWPK